MGIAVDNTMHPWPIGSVPLSNFSHSHLESGGQPPMENGHFAAPKYKRRRVSAVRDFPPGCGRFAAHKFLNTIVEAVVPSTNENSVGREESAPTRSHPVVIVGEATPESKGVNESPSDNSQPSGILLAETPRSLDSRELSDSIEGLEHQTTHLTSCQSQRHKYPPRRSISAVRDFPPFCGRNAPSLGEDRVVKMVSSAANKSLVQEKPCIAEGPTKQTMKGSEEVSILVEDIQQQYGPKSNADPNRSECMTPAPKEDSEDVELMLEQPVVHGQKASEAFKEKAGCKIKFVVADTAEMKRKKSESDNLAGNTAKAKVKRNDSRCKYQSKSVSWKMKDFMNVGGTSGKKTSFNEGKAYQGMGQMVALSKEDYQDHDGEDNNFLLVRRSSDLNVNLPPSYPSKLRGGSDHRSKVRETLRLFHAICRKLLQAKESKQGNAPRRIDLHASKILKEKGRYLNIEKIIGSVPGVEVGDEFMYRVELNVIGLHRQIQGGIDYIKQGKRILATSIVASGGYDDDVDDSDTLIYTGSGGNFMGGDKKPEDQKLEQGNLALKNSADEKNPVRVIRGDMKLSDDGKARTYIYDGLYVVEKWWQELGQHGKLVFKFKLVRMLGQPQLAWKVVKKSKNFKVREGLCVHDISHGKEVIPICAVNAIDDEKPPSFQYITNMIYPKWIQPTPQKGCSCTNGCSESGRCACAAKNSGEMPFTFNGAIVETKVLVYECGPSCKCPPSCHNRVSQNGIRFQLEIFKTELRGWGVRSLNSVPSGSFICEYIGEIVEEKEADQRTGNDDYLFDIGNLYNDCSVWNELSHVMPGAHLSSHEVAERSSFTIDAASFGNIGRFINHSCSPNLYAQNVLYDHEDKRIPHIMFFATENIPPLQELTYHYNYAVGQVRDSDGNIKKKNCYCGSSECTGRMY